MKKNKLSQIEEATKLLNRIHSYNLSYKEKIIKTDEIIQKNRECHFSKIFAYRYLLEGKYFLQRGRNEEAKNAFNKLSGEISHIADFRDRIWFQKSYYRGLIDVNKNMNNNKIVKILEEKLKHLELQGSNNNK